MTGRDGITRDETEYVSVAWPAIYAVKYQVALEILTATGGLRQTQNAVVMLGARWHGDLGVLAPI